MNWADFKPKAEHLTKPMELVERAFWQSRAGLKSPPELTDLVALARKL